MSKTRLIEAVKHLDLKETKEILEAKPELLKVWNEQGRNLLHLACSADCKRLEKPESAAVKMVTLLLDRGLDIEKTAAPDKRGRTALHIGIEKEYDPALLKWLVRQGASPDIPDRDGVTARQRAGRKRNKQFLAALET